MNYRKLGIFVANPYLNPLFEISGQLNSGFNTEYVNYSSGSGYLFISSKSNTLAIPLTGQDKLLIFKNGN